MNKCLEIRWYLTEGSNLPTVTIPSEITKPTWYTTYTWDGSNVRMINNDSAFLDYEDTIRRTASVSICRVQLEEESCTDFEAIPQAVERLLLPLNEQTEDINKWKPLTTYAVNDTIYEISNAYKYICIFPGVSGINTPAFSTLNFLDILNENPNSSDFYAYPVWMKVRSDDYGNVGDFKFTHRTVLNTVGQATDMSKYAWQCLTNGSSRFSANVWSKYYRLYLYAKESGLVTSVANLTLPEYTGYFGCDDSVITTASIFYFPAISGQLFRAATNDSTFALGAGQSTTVLSDVTVTATGYGTITVNTVKDSEVVDNAVNYNVFIKY